MGLRLVSLLLFVGPLLGAAPAPPPAPVLPLTVAVFPVTVRGDAPELTDAAALLTGSLTARLADVAGCRVLGADEVAELLRAEAQQQAVGCQDVSCLAELAGALGAQRMVSSELARVGAEYLWSLSMVSQGDGEVLQRTQARGRSTQALAAQVEEVAYALVGRAQEVSLDAPGAWRRLGFVNEDDFQSFRRYRLGVPERSVPEALTQFIVDHNTESNSLAAVEAAAFLGGAMVPGLVYALAVSSTFFTSSVPAAPVGLALGVLNLALLPVGLGLVTTGVVLALVDALNLGRVRVKSTGCCRQDGDIRDAEESSGLRRASAVAVALSGGVGLAGCISLLILPSALTSLLPRLVPSRTLEERDRSLASPLGQASSAANILAITVAFFGGLATIPVGLTTGLLLLFWPGAPAVEDEE